MANKLRQAIDKLINEVMDEQFITISNDNMFRVYLNPRRGLIELEQMDRDGSVSEMVLSLTMCAFGFTTSEASQRVLRFAGFLDRWNEQFEYRLNRQQAIELFDHIAAIVKLSFTNE